MNLINISKKQISITGIGNIINAEEFLEDWVNTD